MDEVCGPAFFALLVTGVAFLPILALDGQEGRLFQPLAWAKTLTILVAAILAITLDPALPPLLLAQWLPHPAKPESRHRFSSDLDPIYTPVVEFVSAQTGRAGRRSAAFAVTIPAWPRIGTELMPPLDEGVLLYMPSTMPGISIAEATRLLRATDRS